MGSRCRCREAYTARKGFRAGIGTPSTARASVKSARTLSGMPCRRRGHAPTNHQRVPVVRPSTQAPLEPPGSGCQGLLADRHGVMPRRLAPFPPAPGLLPLPQDQPSHHATVTT